MGDRAIEWSPAEHQVGATETWPNVGEIFAADFIEGPLDFGKRLPVSLHEITIEHHSGGVKLPQTVIVMAYTMIFLLNYPRKLLLENGSTEYLYTVETIP